MIIYDAMLYRNKPAALPPVSVVYNVGFKIERFWPGGFNGRMPLESDVRKAAREEAAKNTDYSIIDIEYWPLRTDAEVAENLPKLIQILRWMRDEVPSLKLGFYGLVPTYDEQLTYFDESTDYFKQYQALNDKLQPLADVVDALFPSCYTMHKIGYQAQWPTGWATYTRAMIKEARRLAPSKPVFPFIWPQYHNGSTPKSLAYQYIDGDYWAMQLGVLSTWADGCVLWGTGVEFDADHEWWKVSEGFMNY